jgi:hypothetical protein
MCGIKYSSDEEGLSKHNDTIPVTTTQLARHQVCVIINTKTGAEISMGEHTPRANIGRRQDGEASDSNTNTTFSIYREEWAAARNAVFNNTSLPIGVSVGTLNAYHAILEKNRSRLAKEKAELDLRQQVADLSSER